MSDEPKFERHPSTAEGWYVGSQMPTLEQDVEAARARFVAWLTWYMRNPKHEVSTKEALAKKLGCTRSAVSQLLAPGAKRAPDFRTLVAAARLVGFGFEALLSHDPPQDE